jgi:hypothetical protein
LGSQRNGIFAKLPMAELVFDSLHKIGNDK